jgi:hypothetical protein
MIADNLSAKIAFFNDPGLRAELLKHGKVARLAYMLANESVGVSTPR